MQNYSCYNSFHKKLYLSCDQKCGQIFDYTSDCTKLQKIIIMKEYFVDLSQFFIAANGKGNFSKKKIYSLILSILIILVNELFNSFKFSLLEVENIEANNKITNIIGISIIAVMF